MERLQQLDLFAPAIAASGLYDVAVTPEVSEWLASGAVFAAGCSGGKDSTALALRLAEYLDEIGHKGPRVLIHSDLGVVEWKDSLPVCERLAKRLGWELIVLRRAAGDMMDRWEARWASSLERYSSLSCVKIILPWSTPGMRFCTSELKTDLICRELTKRYPGQKILSATGVRHDESAARSKMPIASPQPKLSARGCQGMNWNPIAPWSTPSVYDYIALKQEPLHEAYTVYKSTRVSCAFCFSGETEVLTRAGVKQIRDLAGEVHTLLVPKINAKNGLTTHGAFKDVSVREFGEQRLLRIELKKPRRQHKTLYATAEHRWFVSTTSERGDPCSVVKTTAELKPGDRLKNLLANDCNSTSEVPFAVAQGFVFGDGASGCGDRPARLPIYNLEKDAAILPYFAQHKVIQGKTGVTVKSLPRSWKNLPDIKESRSFILSWLAGYFAADGCVSKLGAARLDSASRANIEFARDIAEICGVSHGAIRTTMREGTGVEETPLYSMNLNPRDLPDWFFIIDEHKRRVKNLGERQGATREQWIVEGVSETDRVETVYCAEVPQVHAFALADGLMTGNCIMGSAGDLKASASCPDNAEIYRRMVRLEIASTFALQGAKWLGDVAPHLLSPEEREGLDDAKRRASLRVAAEARLPKHLLYTSGWPTCVPSEEEAQLIAEVRQEVASILGITVGFTTAGDVIARYQELIAVRQAKVC